MRLQLVIRELPGPRGILRIIHAHESINRKAEVETWLDRMGRIRANNPSPCLHPVHPVHPC